MYRASLLLLQSESVYKDRGYTIAVECGNRNLYFNYLLDENNIILYDDIKRNDNDNNDEDNDTSQDNNDGDVQEVLYKEEDFHNNDNNNDVQLVVYQAKYKTIRPIAIDNTIATMQLVVLHQGVHEDDNTIAVMQLVLLYQTIQNNENKDNFNYFLICNFFLLYCRKIPFIY